MENNKDWKLSTLLASAENQGGMLISSSRLRKVFERVERIAPFNVTVLIEGESGTGKELVAGALHRLGANPRGPFVALNCATLIGQLAESQLFGHVRGAFTDARDNALGYFRAAQGGTLFLDEVGELPLELQPKILRAVENHEVQSVGSYQSVHVDVRLVAATNRNLRSMVTAGTFREDLFHRLNAVSVGTEPLRESREAIAPLAAYFLLLHGNAAGKSITHISASALRILIGYNWPGNVRELNHAMHAAVLMTEANRIEEGDLPPHVIANESPIAHAREPEEPDPCATTILEEEPDQEALPIGTGLDLMTRTALRKSLERTRGNRQQAAKMLGISRQKLYRMIARYDLAHAGRHS